MRYSFTTLLMCFPALLLLGQNHNNGTQRQRAEARVAEIGKIVTLDSLQQRSMKDNITAYNMVCDSISSDQTKDQHEKDKWQRKVNKQYQSAFMNTFSDEQRVVYLTAITQTATDSLVKAEMNILQNTQLFSATELDNLKKELTQYHRQEQFILERDKYDINSRRENLEWLKKRSSNTFKYCEHILKMQKEGVIKDGNIKWQTNN